MHSLSFFLSKSNKDDTTSTRVARDRHDTRFQMHGGGLGRKSLYYPYKSTHKSVYLKFRRLLDYNYEDWEPTTSFYLPDFNQTNSTHDVSKIATVTETVSRTVPDVTITGDTLSTINTTLPKDNFTAKSNITVTKDTLTTIKKVVNTTTKQTFVETTTKVNLTEVVTTISDVTNVTNIISKETIASNISVLELKNTTTTGLNEAEDLLKELLSSTSSPVTTHVVSPPTIAMYSPGTVSDSGPPHVIEISTPNPILEDIKELHRKDGYFTASLIMLLRILLTFERSYIRTLLGTLEFELERRDRENLLTIFGGKPTEVFLSAIQILVPEPLDVMQSQLSYVIYALENRNSMFKEDINSLLDITNTVYLQSDAEDIATVLADLKSFPNSSSAEVLINGLLKTFVTEPFVRLHGSVREKLMIAEINDIIEHRFGEHIFNRRMGLMGYGSTALFI
ncbi:unnamed protein product, partial [Brenthis ino]